MIVNPYESPQVEIAQRDPEIAAPAPADVNRLGPLHGLLYLFGVMIAAALDSTIRDCVRAQHFPLDWWPALVTVALDGVGIAAILWFGWQRVSRAPAFPRSFGHWLLLVQGVNCVVDSLYRIIYFRYLPPGSDLETLVTPDVNFQLRTINALMVTPAAVMLLLAIRFHREQTVWVRYGVILLASVLLAAVWNFVGWENTELANTLDTALSFLGLLCIMVAAVRDFNHPEGFDQLHWTGIVSQLALILWVRFTASYWASFAEY